MEGAVAVAGEAAKLVGSRGAGARFFLASAAGEEVNSTLFAMEFDSPEALGQTFDDLADDAELQALMTRLNGPKSPSAVTSQCMGFEDAPRSRVRVPFWRFTRCESSRAA